MKNKTKIVIEAGILSMSLCTVIGTGVVNFGQLLAENNTQVAVASPQSFNVGDKIIIGGLEFIMINPQQSRLLSQTNFGYEVAYENIPSL